MPGRTDKSDKCHKSRKTGFGHHLSILHHSTREGACVPDLVQSNFRNPKAVRPGILTEQPRPRRHPRDGPTDHPNRHIPSCGGRPCVPPLRRPGAKHRRNISADFHRNGNATALYLLRRGFLAKRHGKPDRVSRFPVLACGRGSRHKASVTVPTAPGGVRGEAAGIFLPLSRCVCDVHFHFTVRRYIHSPTPVKDYLR